jgi:hypothetical protein
MELTECSRVCETERQVVQLKAQLSASHDLAMLSKFALKWHGKIGATKKTPKQRTLSALLRLAHKMKMTGRLDFAGCVVLSWQHTCGVCDVMMNCVQASQRKNCCRR